LLRGQRDYKYVEEGSGDKDSKRHCRAAVRVSGRVEEKKAGGRRAGRRELPCSRGATEQNPTAVHTYYQKRNNSKLGALLGLLSTKPTYY